MAGKLWKIFRDTRETHGRYSGHMMDNVVNNNGCVVMTYHKARENVVRKQEMNMRK